MAVKDLYKDRQYVIQIVFVVAAIILVFRAAQLQLIDTSYREKASATAIDKYTLYPPRGLIYDRNGKLLINNSAMYDIMVTYKQLSARMDTAKLCRLLGITDSIFVQNMTKDWKSGRYSKSIPFPFLTRIAPEVYARFQEHLFEFPGFSMQLRNARSYPYECGGQLLGYIKEVDPEQIDRSNGKYTIGDYIGANGLEKAYEEDLRGKKGFQYLLKDNLGRMVGSYKNGELDSAAISGRDLISSIDADLQEYGEKLMRGKSGGIVAIEPSTGEILTLISAPTYDPNLLTVDRRRGEAYIQLNGDPSKPLFPRPVMGIYPPGSVFKTLVALVGLQEGTWGVDYSVGCRGGYRLSASKVVKCHHHPGVGNLVGAIQHSCNAYFCTAFKSIVDKYGYTNPQPGLDTFYRHLQDFGLGRKLGIDFPSEQGGNIPSAAYYDKIYPKALGSWRAQTIISLGIGQGELQLTTLQIANLAAAIGNKGYFYTPHLAKGFKDGGKIPEKYRQKHLTRIDQKYFYPVVEGMERVVQAGTARGGFVPDISICGKTGTAQNHQDPDKDHSVFFAFAPKENPKIAIAVYVEFGGWGSDFAVPIASLMIEKYLRGHIESPERKAKEEKMFKTRLLPEAPYEKPILPPFVQVPTTTTPKPEKKVPVLPAQVN